MISCQVLFGTAELSMLTFGLFRVSHGFAEAVRVEKLNNDPDLLLVGHYVVHTRQATGSFANNQHNEKENNMNIEELLTKYTNLAHKPMTCTGLLKTIFIASCMTTS